MIVRKTFPVGRNSTATVIPKKFGIKPGTHLICEKRGDEIILRPLIK